MVIVVADEVSFDKKSHTAVQITSDTGIKSAAVCFSLNKYVYNSFLPGKRNSILVS